MSHYHFPMRTAGQPSFFARSRVAAPNLTSGLAALAGFASLAAGCSVSADLTAPAPMPTPTEVAVAAPTATPAGEPPPTPTPTAVPLVDDEVLWQAIDDNLAVLDELDLEYSFVVATLDGDTVLKHRAATSLLPASNQKIITAVAVLELLDHDHRFVTELRVDDANNVYIVGGGDPTLEQDDLETFAQALINRLGVTTERPVASGSVRDTNDTIVVTTIGDLVVDPTYFPPTRTAPGWPSRYMPGDVGPMSGLWIDNNQHRGDAGYVNNPDQGNARLIADLFAAKDISVTGRIGVGEVPADTTLVASIRSRPVSSLVATILGRSDNEVAEALVRQISLDAGGSGETPDGQVLVFAALADLGIDLGEARGDGSGLSRDNRLSARQLVDTLAVAATREWWDVLEGGLAEAGAAEGTLEVRLRSDTTAGNVKAKTGTLDDARSLAGVFDTVDGQSMVFALIVNGEDAPLSVVPMDRLVVALASATAAQLAAAS